MKLLIATTAPETVFLAMEEQIPFFVKSGIDVTVITSPGTWITTNDIMDKYGIKVHAVDFTRYISPMSDIKTIFRLINILKKECPDVLYVSTPKASLLSLIASRFIKIPFILYTIRGIPYQRMTGMKKLVFTFIEKFCCTAASQVLSVSNSNLKYLIDNNLCDENKIKVIGNGSSHGVDHDKFDPTAIDVNIQNELRTKHNIKGTDFIFGFVGRMVKDKGIEDIAKAWKIISENKNNIQLILVGPLIEPRDMVSHECYQYLNSNERIHLVNDVKNPFHYHSLFDVLLLPSYREGFPNVILEAGSMGIPCITTNSLGCIDSVIDGVTGFIHQTANIDELVEKMETLYKNRELCDAFGKNARKHVVDNFDPLNISNEILKIFKKGTANE